MGEPATAGESVALVRGSHILVKPYRMRAAPTTKGIFIGDTVEIYLIIDHGCRVYSEQLFELSGVVPKDGVQTLMIQSFIDNWITHAGKPSTLWVVSFVERPGGGWVAAIERDGLDELGKNTTGDLHSLAADLVEHGLCVASEPDA